MGIKDFPQEKLARRVLVKHKLTIPFDLDTLVRKYATLVYKSIPYTGVDGVSMNIKTPGKTPKIIINDNLPPTRMKFTLAHELGHLVIPWHFGTFIDDIDESRLSMAAVEYEYRELEQEANLFAAELLMPHEWVKNLCDEENDLAKLHSSICSIAGVSEIAAAIRLTHFLPSDILFCMVDDDDIVRYSGKTGGTHAFIQSQGGRFSDSFYSNVADHFSFYSKGTTIHWWKLETTVSVIDDDDRTWREVLNEMVNDLYVDDPEGYKKSINSIIAAANGNVSRSPNYSIERLTSVAMQRLKRPELSDFTEHEDFEIFVRKKAEALFNNKVGS